MAKYDRAEAERILVTYAQGIAPGPSLPEIEAFLLEFADLAQRAGLHVERNGKLAGKLAIAKSERHDAITILLQDTGELLIADRMGRQPFDRVPIVWNPLSGQYEGQEDDPHSHETGYKKLKRSALAVLTEAVVKRLER